MGEMSALLRLIPFFLECCSAIAATQGVSKRHIRQPGAMLQLRDPKLPLMVCLQTTIKQNGCDTAKCRIC
jgi:hypothetical protein